MLSPEDFKPGQWRDYLRLQFARMREVCSADDLVTDLMFSHNADYSRKTTLFVYEKVERTMRYLVDAGFTLHSAWHIHSALSMFTRGFIVTERVRRVNGTPPQGREQLNLLDLDAMPLLAQLVAEEPVVIDTTGDASFTYGLDLIIDSAAGRWEAEQGGR